MSTDPFTESARAEAERRHPAPEIETGAQIGYTQTQIREVVRRTFTNAAEWARTHLAAQEATDADELIVVAWTDCDCEWVTNYCDEYHRRTTRIPRSVLTRAARRDEEKR